MLFADDTAVVAHTQMELQSLMDGFYQTCEDLQWRIQSWSQGGFPKVAN